jgi:hypothetical protein
LKIKDLTREVRGRTSANGPFVRSGAGYPQLTEAFFKGDSQKSWQLKQSFRRSLRKMICALTIHGAMVRRGYLPSNLREIPIRWPAVLILYRLIAAMRVKASNSKAKPAPAVETSDSINAQIAAFLKSGGEIQQIAKGVSGQTFGPSKQISLGKK